MDNISNVLRSLASSQQGQLTTGKATNDTHLHLPEIRRDPPLTLVPRPKNTNVHIPSQDRICTICHGDGYIVANVQPGHPDFGKALPCQCKLQERMWRQINEFHETSELDTLSHYQFESFNLDLTWLSDSSRTSLQRAFDASVEFSRNPQGWLILLGTYGCGKTHLAASIANHRVDRGKSAIFVVVPDLLDHLRSTFGPTSEISYDEMFDQVRSTEVLILDDFGSQSSTAWAQEKLFQILNYRYNTRLPTVITTNQKISAIEERIRSRMLDSVLAQVIHIAAPDFRRQNTLPDQNDLSTLHLHKDKSFDNFIIERRNLQHKEASNLRKVLDNSLEYAQSPVGLFILQGQSGTGKTHLAAAIANYQIKNFLSQVLFVSVADLLDYLRAAFDPQSSTPYDRRFEEVKKSGFLILDDLGMESATSWAKEKLYQLLDYRYNALLPTVITTRLSDKRLDDWLKTRFQDLTRSKWQKLSIAEFQGTTDQEEILAKRGTREIDFFSGDERSLR